LRAKVHLFSKEKLDLTFISLPLCPISLGVPLQAEIIPFEPEQVSTCGGTKMPFGGISGKSSLFNYEL